MKIKDVVDFIEAGETVFRRERPTVGATEPWIPVYDAAMAGHFLSWSYSPADVTDAFDTRVAYVREIVPLTDAVVVVIDEAFPPTTMRFQRAKGDLLRLWQVGLERYAVGEDEAELAVQQSVTNPPPVPADPKLNIDVLFMRWSEYDSPRGIFFLEKDTFRALAFPVYDGEEEQFDGRFKGITERDFIEEVPALLGQSTFVSGAEWSRGISAADCALRALYKYGEEYYQKTGRSLF